MPPSAAAGRYSATPSRSRRPSSTQQIGSAMKIHTSAPTSAPTWEWTAPPTAAPRIPASSDADERPPGAVTRLAELERHVEDAEPDDRGHSDGDQREEHERGPCYRTGDELDADEPRASRHRQERPRDRSVAKLVRHEDHSHEQGEDRGRKCRVQDHPKLELGVEPLSLPRAPDVPRGHECRESHRDEREPPRAS